MRQWVARRTTRLIAQEVHKLLPSVAIAPKVAGDEYQMKYHYLVPYLITGVLQADSRVSILEEAERIAEGKWTEMDTEIETLKNGVHELEILGGVVNVQTRYTPRREAI
jgi:hypothetical protein